MALKVVLQITVQKVIPPFHSVLLLPPPLLLPPLWCFVQFCFSVFAPFEAGGRKTQLCLSVLETGLYWIEDKYSFASLTSKLKGLLVGKCTWGLREFFLLPFLFQTFLTVKCFSCFVRKYSAWHKDGSFHYIHHTSFGKYSFICADATLVPGPKRPYNFFGILNPVM